MKINITALLLLILLGCDLNFQPEYQWNIPEKLPKPVTPENNPMTKESTELGRHLFYDKRLSANQTQSCATCHQQTYAFSDPKKIAIGSTGQAGTRNSQSLVNIAFNTSFTWAHNGLNTIEQQLLIPMFGEDPIELGISGHEEAILQRFSSDKHYQSLFQQAYPNKEISFALIIQAIANFVRSLTSFNSPFDSYAFHNQDDALSQSAIRGMDLFFSEKVECHHCHGGFNFTQSSTHANSELLESPFHNTGLFNLDGKGGLPKEDQGLYKITQNPKHMGAFRAPSLRNIAVSAPYMHDGSIPTLEKVIEFYADGGRNIIEGPHQGDGRISPLKSQFVKGFEITDEEKQDLINFLHSLTDQAFLDNPKFSNPFKSNRDSDSQTQSQTQPEH